ncbi:MAG: insulinase family protein, partial [Gemmatimonadaceae bacterium]|nr:insulinase family protein [Gemmatimonadaceae bacterium]
PATAKLAVDAINVVLARVTREGLSAGDLASAKSQLKGQLTLSLESPSSRMYRAAGTELYGEPFRTLDETLALIDEITQDDVAAVASEFFAPERQTILSLGPAAA